ncbi:13055_t:CDS:1, partial [Dentiscutata heterogama]
AHYYYSSWKLSFLSEQTTSMANNTSILKLVVQCGTVGEDHTRN